MPIGGALKLKGAALPTKDKCVRAWMPACFR